MVQKGLIPTRERARRLILAGKVLVNGSLVDKAGTMVNSEAELHITEEERYVSRGGIKLEKALQEFNIDVHGKIAIDVGASTGGFTDCLLQNGAKKVYAVDVGYGQFAWKLRQDKRVVLMERTNARYLKPGDFPEKMDLAVIDVSFISLSKIIPVVRDLIKEDGETVALIKPQFEAGKDKVGRGGIVRDPKVREEVLRKIVDMVEDEGLIRSGLIPSPIKGADGNIEYLISLRKRVV